MKKLTLATVTALILGTTAATYAATIPFDEDFDDDSTTPPTEQSTSWNEAVDIGDGSASWSLVDSGGGDNVYRSSVSSSGSDFDTVEAASGIEVADMAGTEFVISSTFTVNEFTKSTGHDRLRLSVAFLSDTADFSNTSMKAMYFGVFDDNSNEGKIRIDDLDGDTTTSSPSTGTLSYAVDSTYTWTISGSYATPGDATSDLTINASLTDGTNTISTSFLDDDGTILTGNYVGFYDVLDHSNTSDTFSSEIDHETLNIIPEPASFALLLLGGVSVLTRRRCRA